jgi:flagellar FliL protein
MKKINFPIKMIFTVMGMVFLTTVTLTTLVMAYIMFAPDNFPKPFYLSYSNPPTTIPNAKANSKPTPTPTPENIIPTSPDQIKPGNGIMLDTGSKIINLIDPTGRKYIRLSVILEFAPNDLGFYKMADEAKKTYETTFNEELKTRLPVMNDAIITLLSAKTFEQVYTAEGKEKLRREITLNVNERLPEYKVIYLYFTEFVVQ